MRIPGSAISLLPGIAAAVIFTLAVNAGTIVATLRHGQSIAYMGTSADDAYYYALIRDAGTGHANLGNVSLKEHAGEIEASSYAPLLQGMLMRVFGWDIATVVLIGDVVFAFLAAFILCLLFRSFVENDWLAALLGLSAAAGGIGLIIQRSISPQITLLPLLAYLAIFLTGKRGKSRSLLRGVLIALMIYLHAVYALYLLLIEVCDALAHWRDIRKNWRGTLDHAVRLCVPLGVAVAVKVMLSLSVEDPVATADTHRRLGIISSHLPAAPMLQLTLGITVIAAFMIRMRSERIGRLRADGLIILLAAGLLALNQSVLHGKDVIFGLYYAIPLRAVLWISWIGLGLMLIRGHRCRLIAAGLLAIYALVPMASETYAWYGPQVRQRADLEASADPAVMAWLAAQTGEKVVLAPYDIADWLPVFTDHYVSFSRYARYQTVRDQELAQRYLLQQAFYPAEQEDRTYNVVFGLYAGHVAARERSACRIKSFFRKSAEECRRDIRDAVFHRNVLRMLDERKADIPALLRQFHVEYVVMPLSTVLPEEAEGMCIFEKSTEDSLIYRCSAS